MLSTSTGLILRISQNPTVVLDVSCSAKVTFNLFLGTRRQAVNLLHILQHTLEIDVQVTQQAVAEVKDQSTDDGELIVIIALLNSSGLDDVPAGLHHIQLDQAVISLSIVGNRVELGLVQAVDVADVSEPWVEQAQVSRSQGRLDTAAVVVAANDDVLDAQVAHGIVDDGHDVEVGVGDEVGDVTVDEDLACLEAHDLIGGDTAVAATDVADCR